MAAIRWFVGSVTSHSAGFVNVLLHLVIPTNIFLLWVHLATIAYSTVSFVDVAVFATNFSFFICCEVSVFRLCFCHFAIVTLLGILDEEDNAVAEEEEEDEFERYDYERIAADDFEIPERDE